MAESPPATYYEGCRDALHWYAWMKDGVSYVGCGMRTLNQALSDVDEAEVAGRFYGQAGL